MFLRNSALNILKTRSRVPFGTASRLPSGVSSGGHKCFHVSTISNLNEIDASKLEITRAPVLKEKQEYSTLKFGQTFSDHMLEIDWDASEGYHTPRIIPYQKLEIDPAASGLHYALQCFEGMKAYIDKDANIRMFRPELNMERMNSSLERLNMPSFNGVEFLKCIKELIKVEKDWIPTEEGYSLYIRPTAVSTHPFLGVAKSQAIKLFVILSPVGPYYPEGFAPVRLYASDDYVRAWPGGTGDTKIGGNYASTISPQTEAAEKGYSQVLWLFQNPETGHREVTEVGTMNCFAFWEKPDGSGRELVTAPLDGTILPGVTRRSILELCKSWGEFEVKERPFTIDELISAKTDGRLIECFGAGTAAVVSPIEAIHYHGIDHEVPLALGSSGELTKRVWENIVGIQYGTVEGPEGWSVVVE